jgi:hypothetical protein
MGIGRAVTAAAIGIAGAGLLTACDWATQSYSDSDDVAQSFTSVRFANDAGGVTIRAGDEASVKREIHYGDEKPGATFRVKDGVLQLDPCDKRNCWIDYEITVPAGTTVTGQLDSGDADISGVAEATVRSSAGGVTVKDVAGPVKVEASSGDVTLADVGGSVVAKVDSGSIQADNVRGDLTLEVSSGDVQARGIGGATKVDADSGSVEVALTAAQNVRVDADSGDVDVTVPAGSYAVSTSSDSGDVTSDIDNDAAGEHRLDLHADSGSITVSRA